MNLPVNMTLFTLFQDEGVEGCSEPIVTYDNFKEAYVKKFALEKEWNCEFSILQHQLGIVNPRSIYQ